MALTRVGLDYLRPRGIDEAMPVQAGYYMDAKKGAREEMLRVRVFMLAVHNLHSITVSTPIALSREICPQPKTTDIRLFISAIVVHVHKVGNISTFRPTAGKKPRREHFEKSVKV
jgi:hypothetical protein